MANAIHILGSSIFKTTLVLTFIIGLVVLNAATLVNSAVHDALYNGLSKFLPTELLQNSPSNKAKKQSSALESSRKKNKHLTSALNSSKERNQHLTSELESSKNKNQHLNKKVTSKKAKIRQATDKVAARAVRNTTLNMTSVPAETVPFVGAGLVLAVTAMDIKDACDTMNDMNEIMSTLEMTEYSGQTSSICGYQVNFKEEYRAMNEDLGGFLQYLKQDSDERLRKFNDAVGGTTAVAVENIKKKTDSWYDALGGTIYYMIHD